MNYVVDVFAAFYLVSPRYYFADVLIDPTDSESETRVQSTENSFSAELFRNWRNIMDGRISDSDYSHLALDFDIGKNSIHRDVITYDTQSIRPDLVLHQSQSLFDPEFQKIYIEVKTSAKPFINNDIQKLCHALYQYKFACAIFISVNSNYNNLISEIRIFCNQEDQRLRSLGIYIDWNNIYFYHSVLISGRRQISMPISFNNIIQ